MHKKPDLIEHLIRLEVMLGELQKDVQEIKHIEKRVAEIEKNQAFIKGFSALATVIVSTIVGVVINYWSKLS